MPRSSMRVDQIIAKAKERSSSSATRCTNCQSSELKQVDRIPGVSLELIKLRCMKCGNRQRTYVSTMRVDRMWLGHRQYEQKQRGMPGQPNQPNPY